MTDWQGWLSAVGGPAAAAGLILAAYELRAGRAERRDNDASQARLISIERQVSNDPLFFRVGVRNHSESPVFDLHLDRIGYIELRDDGAIVPLHAEASFIGTTGSHAAQFGVVTPERVPTEPVLSTSASVWHELEWADPDWHRYFRDIESLKSRADYGVTISFLDSHGRRWKRTNTAPPVRVIRPSERWWQ